MRKPHDKPHGFEFAGWTLLVSLGDFSCYESFPGEGRTKEKKNALVFGRLKDARRQRRSILLREPEVKVSVMRRWVRRRVRPEREILLDIATVSREHLETRQDHSWSSKLKLHNLLAELEACRAKKSS